MNIGLEFHFKSRKVREIDEMRDDGESRKWKEEEFSSSFLFISLPSAVPAVFFYNYFGNFWGRGPSRFTVTKIANSFKIV